MALADVMEALERTSEVELTTIGRVSGREVTVPVWFVREDERLYLLPVQGSDSHWYKNVVKTPTIRLSAGGAEASVQARPITDAAKVNEVIEKFREKYGAGDVKTYYSKLDVAVEVPSS